MAKKKVETEKRRDELVKELLNLSPIKTGEDLNNLMKEMMSMMVENVLKGELDHELGYERYDVKNKTTKNSRNGYSDKTLDTSYGEMEIKVPRDRTGDYDPVLVKKYQRSVNEDLEKKVISMYAKGMTTSDMNEHFKEIYGLGISESKISSITNRVLPVAKEWQQRPLNSIYTVVFMDAIHFHVRQDGRNIKKAVYTSIGITLEGKKEVLGLWIGENESSKFWVGVMNEMKERGVEDIFIACVDGLKGFSEAIAAVYPQTEIQKCIVHQIRNSTKYVSYKDLKEVTTDLKKIYKAVNEQTALCSLDEFEQKWDKKYPKISDSWRKNWPELSTYFKYPQALRTIIYTTNSIENFHRQLRKVTKNRGVFPTDDSLFKILYLATMDITKKWTGKQRNWGEIYSQIYIYFKERIPE